MKSAVFTGSRVPCNIWSRMRAAIGGARISLGARLRILPVLEEGVGMEEVMDFFLVGMESIVENVGVDVVGVTEVLLDTEVGFGMVDLEEGNYEEADAEVV